MRAEYWRVFHACSGSGEETLAVLLRNTVLTTDLGAPSARGQDRVSRQAGFFMAPGEKGRLGGFKTTAFSSRKLLPMHLLVSLLKRFPVVS
jgi:hypothetical protein